MALGLPRGAPQTGDHIAYRYEVTGVLGRGSFGQAREPATAQEGGRCVAAHKERPPALRLQLGCPTCTAVTRLALPLPLPPQVLRAFDHRRGQEVALKVVRNKKR